MQVKAPAITTAAIYPHVPLRASGVAQAIWSTSLPGIQPPEAPRLVTPGILMPSSLQKAFVITECSHIHWYRCLLVCVVSQPNSNLKMLLVTMGLCLLRLLKGCAVGAGRTERSMLRRNNISGADKWLPNMHFNRDFWVPSGIEQNIWKVVWPQVSGHS